MFITCGIITAILVYYASWVWCIEEYSGDFIMNPSRLYERAANMRILRHISYSSFAKARVFLLHITGRTLTLLLFLELAMILGGVALGFIGMYKQFFFCPLCRKWSEEKSKPYKLASAEPEYTLTSIEAIMQMTTPLPNKDHYTVTVFECPHCLNGAYTLRKHQISVESGRYDCKKTTTLLRRMFCPADKIARLKKFITTTGIEGKDDI